MQVLKFWKSSKELLYLQFYATIFDNIIITPKNCHSYTLRVDKKKRTIGKEMSEKYLGWVGE